MLTGSAAGRPREKTAMSGKDSANDKNPARPSRETPKLPRKLYETELYRMQGELVKMQEWMRSAGARIVVIFEGRDAAGKGSTIKRVAADLNPRVPRIVAPPAPGGRAGPVRSQLVQPGRRRTRHGVLHQGGVQPVPAPVPDLRAAAGRGRHPAAQVLVLGQRRGAAAPFPVPAARSHAQLEALADGPGV